MTLIELLVATSVLAMIAVLGWRGLDSIVRTRVALAADLEQMRGMQLAFAQIQNDCAHLADAAVLGRRQSLATAPDRLVMVRTVYEDLQPSRLQVVVYQAGEGGLTRRVSAATRDLVELDALWRAAASGSDAGQSVVLGADVAALAARFWINGGWRTEPVMQPVANAAMSAAGLAPSGLEISLRLHGNDARLHKIFLLGAA
jgi:general secretion pathway protein J